MGPKMILSCPDWMFDQKIFIPILTIIFICVYFTVKCLPYMQRKIKSFYLKHKIFIGSPLETNNITQYGNLAPVDSYEKIEPYEKMLLAAFADKNVKNIAISGAYGSGKSSIIKTFLKRNPQYAMRVINISLASFCCDNDNNKNRPNSQVPLQRLLELSILQQLFYYVTPSKIPYSRFKRISNISCRAVNAH